MNVENVVELKAVSTVRATDDVVIFRDGELAAAPYQALVGAMGEQGEKGETGDQGPPGPLGLPGKDGAQGLQGAPGAAGKDGLAGRVGDPGRDGLDGAVGAPGELGAGFSWRGQFSSKESYSPGDCVRFSGSTFVNLQACTGVLPSTLPVQGFAGKDAMWDLMAVQGDSGPAGTNGTIGSNGTNGTNGAGVQSGGTTDQVLAKNSNADYDTKWVTVAGTGTVTSVSVVTANGVSGSVATATSTPAITLTLGAITPTSVAASGTVTGSNLSGTNTGDYTNENAQDAVGTILTDTATIDFTYDDAGNAITADVKDASITLAKMADMVTASVIYRKTAGTGVPEVNTLATVKTDLGLTGTNSGDQTITLTGNVTGTGTGSFAATIANDAVTYAKMQNVSATDMVLGRSTAGAGDPEEIACTSFGRALIDDTSTSAQRTTLGLAIGTDVQAYDAELSALAGLTSAADKVPYFTGSGTAAVADFSSAGRALVDDASAAAQVTTLGLDNTKIATISFVIDGGGSAITTGIKGDLEIPFGCTINRVTTLADQSGSIVVDIWKDTYANYPPTVADTITASAKPTLSTATKAQDATLTGWTTSITAGDTIRFNVDSITTCTRVLISLKVTKT